MSNLMEPHCAVCRATLRRCDYPGCTATLPTHHIDTLGSRQVAHLCADHWRAAIRPRHLVRPALRQGSGQALKQEATS